MKPLVTGWRAWALALIICIVGPLVMFEWLLPCLSGYLGERSRVAIVQRYQELAATGKLEMPPEGISAVSFMGGRHPGDRPKFIRFYREDPQRSTIRYLIVRGQVPGGKSVWQFRDQVTGELIY